MKGDIDQQLFGTSYLYLGLLFIERTHTVCFSISFYNVNQMPTSPRNNFHCETIRS